MSGLDALKQMQQENWDNKGQCVERCLNIQWVEGRRDSSVSCRDSCKKNKNEAGADETWQSETTFMSEVWFDGKTTNDAHDYL